MNCAQAEKNFAALLDDSLDHERLHEIKEHLDACSRCSEELSGLAESQRLISALPPVEPPLGFTTRVMAQVRETAHRPTLWQRLLLSIPKLPLQATTVILISVLAAYLYQKESRHREAARTAPPTSSFETREETDSPPSSSAQSPRLESKVQVAKETGAQGRREERSSAPEQPGSFSESEERNKTIDRVQPGAAATAPTRNHPNSALTAPQPNEKSSSGDKAASARLEESLPSAKAQAKGVPQPGPFHNHDSALSDFTPAAKSPASDAVGESRASSLDARRSAPALASDQELTLRLKEPVRDDKNAAAPPQLERFQAEPQASPSRTTFKDFDGARQRAIQTGQPQTVSAIIDASQYDGFKKELASLGKIESEKAAPANEIDALSKSSGQLRITITILPPNSSAQPPSTR